MGAAVPAAVRNRTAWLLVAIFALMGSAYYGLSAWVPDAYVERGWSDIDVGWLIAAMNLTAVPASFLVPRSPTGTAAASRISS